MVAAIVFVGPITVAASLFPRYARQAVAELPAHGGPDGVVRALHRISSGYAVLAVSVPVLGIATAAQLQVLDDWWVWLSMALTGVAALLLLASIVPGQRGVLRDLDARAPDSDPATSVVAALPRLSMVTGLFNLTWAAVVVLMIVRPGSTTGV